MQLLLSKLNLFSEKKDDFLNILGTFLNFQKLGWGFLRFVIPAEAGIQEY